MITLGGMSTTLRVDFVSDVACPWCVVGLYALEQALVSLSDEVEVRIQLQPFELNPSMGVDGEDLLEHLMHKYGRSADELAQAREIINRRGLEAGFVFRPEGRGRVWNTFALHRLIQWADAEQTHDRAMALNKAFMTAYHGRAENMAARDVILACCERAGVDMARAKEVLDSDLYAEAVRERQDHFSRLGIRSVPACVVNDQYLISGGQPAEVFVQALRQIAQSTAAEGNAAPQA